MWLDASLPVIILPLFYTRHLLQKTPLFLISNVLYKKKLSLFHIQHLSQKINFLFSISSIILSLFLNTYFLTFILLQYNTCFIVIIINLVPQLQSTLNYFCEKPPPPKNKIITNSCTFTFLLRFYKYIGFWTKCVLYKICVLAVITIWII